MNKNKKSHSKNSKINQKSSIQDTKLKPLSPTLRQKKRFIKVKIHSNQEFDFKTLSENLLDEIIKYLGTIETGKAGIWLLRDKFNENEQTIILKCSTKTHKKLIGILSLIQNINNEPVNIETINVSGTLKGVEKIK